MAEKIIVIGPKSTHVVRFIDLIKELFNEIIFIGEEPIISDFVTRQYQINFRSKNPYVIYKNYKLLKEIVKNENADIAHFHQVNRVSFIAARIHKKLNKKYIITAWGSDVLIVPNRNWIVRKMVRFVLSFGEVITADSNDMIDAINKMVPDKNCELVFFGVDLIEYCEKEKIVYSNRSLYALYQIDKVIDEFYEFQKNHKEWKLVIAGNGDELESLKEKVRQLNLENCVVFEGWLSRELNLKNYQSSAIYISFPVSDGTSVSLLEAMSAGCIPVVSDLKVAHEWIEDGVNGIIKQKSLNAIEEALKLNPAEVAKINRQIVKSRATGEIATQKFKSIFERTLDDSTDKK